jgi:hypothetical protein
MKVIQVELKNYNRRADSSVSFRADSLIELSSKEIGEVDSYRGSVGFLVLTDIMIGNEVKVDVNEILKNLPENDAIDNYKSPSKRFRDILWRLLEQDLGRKPSKEEFADYYKREYDKICSHYKDKFDEDLV